MLNNPTNLFRGDAEIVNSTPATNFAINMMAKEAAKRDALDKYFLDLGSKLTPAGMHSDDIPKLIEAKNDWQKYSMENRKAIRNPSLDNGISLREAQAKYNNALGVSEKSKFKIDDLARVNKVRDNPEMAARLTEDDLKRVHRAGLPVTDPNYQPFGNFNFSPKGYSAKDWQAFDKSAMASITPDKTLTEYKAHPTDKFSEIEVTSKGFSPKVKAAHGTQMGSYFDSDPSIRNSFVQSHPFKQWKPEHEAEYNRLNDVFKEAYGKDANIKDERDLFIATKIDEHTQPTISEKEVKNSGKLFDAQTAKALQMQANSFAHADKLQARSFAHQDSKPAKEQSQMNGWIDEFIDDGVTKSKRYPVVDGFRIIPLDPITSKSFTKSGVPAMAIKISEDGKTFVPIYSVYDEKGNPTNEPNTTLSQPLTRDEVKLTLGYKALTKKELSKEMSENKRAELPKGAVKNSSGLPVFK